jgi:ABC-2 type transport system ATP-binding protein
MIKLDHVTKTYGDKTAVNDITFEVPTGAITGFIGPNGAGKTTTINMITGALKPDAGTITLNGKNIQTDPLDAKFQFCLVPDSPDIFLRLKGMEYINFMADLYKVDQTVRTQRIESLAKEFGMEEALKAQMMSYSHGMRQKAIIMAALVCSPSIWILDEPMTGLDPEAAYLLKQKMKEHAAAGNTVFFSTHVLEVAEKLCDKIVLISQAEIQYDGTLDDLKAEHPGQTLEEIFLETVHE